MASDLDAALEEVDDTDVTESQYEDDVRYRVLRMSHKDLEKNFLFVHQTKAQLHLLKR